ncbi:hypothetical protein BRD12_09005 [Halobacteriales archaeon SW_12_67_38]|nr:MAG: hypothetical protein BRD12_09005 [Halobacteriales archaeon SW_12_67_38]
MSPNGAPDASPERDSPVGEPVIRGDPTFAGERAGEAVQFDPDDPESVTRAAGIVRSFADDSVGDADSVYMLRGAGDATVSFIRKWARVHDLPRSIRQYVATGEIAPTAAKHIARVTGEARFLLAWATLDADLTVRDVRSIASDANSGTPPERALSAHGVPPGEVTLDLPPETYRELRRQAALRGVDPAALVAEALDAWEPTEDSPPERY